MYVVILDMFLSVSQHDCLTILPWLKLRTMIQWFATLECNWLNWQKPLEEAACFGRSQSFFLHFAPWPKRQSFNLFYVWMKREPCTMLIHVAKFVQSSQAVKQWIWPLKAKVATSVSKQEIQLECMEPQDVDQIWSNINHLHPHGKEGNKWCGSFWQRI